MFNVLERLQLNCLTFIEYNINPAQQSQKIERHYFTEQHRRITVFYSSRTILLGFLPLALPRMFWWEMKPKIVCPARQQEKSSLELMRPIMFFLHSQTNLAIYLSRVFYAPNLLVLSISLCTEIFRILSFRVWNIFLFPKTKVRTDQFHWPEQTVHIKNK